MEAYPAEYAAHNLPLIVLSGLGSETSRDSYLQESERVVDYGTGISSDLPPVEGERAEQLLQEFQKADGAQRPWNGRPDRKGDLIGFGFRVVGRDFALPARKARPPQTPSTTAAGPEPSWVLHSSLSPLSPDSPLFPDGVMTPMWIAKHQHDVPAVYISFFEFRSDPSRNTIHDNKLKSEINGIKAALVRSEYKTRHVVVLLSDKTILEAPEIEERLSTIKRATGLDPKNSLFFLPPNISRVEVSSFVTSVLSALQPVCIEYYRDLTKHARRKKGRGTIPAPTLPPTRGTSQTLSQLGWSLRYDFKLGVFAEFRQEMDAASRHYTFALDALLGPDGIFETTAGWSPRWDETRLLADTLALRSLRCLLWTNQTTSAVQLWVNFRNRMRDLVDRRGKGSDSYGWKAWESRMAKMMAQAVQRAELPVFAASEPVKVGEVLTERENATYAPPEKAFPIGERLQPWHLLHHPGYWLRLSARYTIERRLLAKNIPEEDRFPPGELARSPLASRHGRYDTYLCPEPHIEMPVQGDQGFDHAHEVIETLNHSVGHFYPRGQQRFVDKLELDVGKELLRCGRYGEAVSVLQPLWEGMIWRKERWWNLAREVTIALYHSALYVQNAQVVVATAWELLGKDFHAVGHVREFAKCLDRFSSGEEKTKVTVRAEEISSLMSISYSFAATEGHVGEPLISQIAIRSSAHHDSAAVTLSHIVVDFKGYLGQVRISHSEESDEATSSSAGAVSLLYVTLRENEEGKKSAVPPKAEGSANLTFLPGQTKVYEIRTVPREAGEVVAVTATIHVAADRFDFELFTPLLSGETRPVWWLPGARGPRTKRLVCDDGATTRILPKPPKMEIRFTNIREVYYTSEPIVLDIEITNEEDVEAEAVLDVRLLGHSEQALGFSWVSKHPSDDTAAITTEVNETDLPGHPIGRMVSLSRRTESISFTAPPVSSEYTLEVKVLYHLLTDIETPVSKTLAASLMFVNPFESNYDFAPLLHRDPWPSFFDMQTSLPAESEDETEPTTGLAQRWSLTAKIVSFAEDELIIQKTDLLVLGVNGGARCSVSPEPVSSEKLIRPREQHQSSFIIDINKISLEDRRSSSLDLNLAVTWQRATSVAEDQPSSVTATLVIPNLVVPSSEPRVLAAAQASAAIPSLVHLDYTIENPTMHFLTFDVSMDASEDFAFSGCKFGAVHLLPVSRQTVRYNILPLVRGAWIAPQLKVVDRYFNKTLKVLATEGLKMDKRGIVIWINDGEKGS